MSEPRFTPFTIAVTNRGITNETHNHTASHFTLHYSLFTLLNCSIGGRGMKNLFTDMIAAFVQRGGMVAQGFGGNCNRTILNRSGKYGECPY